MSEVPGLSHLLANYEVVNKVDNDVEVEVTTGSSVQDGDAATLLGQGWVRRGSNVFAYLKQKVDVEDVVNMVVQPVEETQWVVTEIECPE